MIDDDGPVEQDGPEDGKVTIGAGEVRRMLQEIADIRAGLERIENRLRTALRKSGG